MTDGKLNYNPLYLQVRDVLHKRIVDGAYPSGKAIPSESKLAADFGTSISTIRQALSLLVAEGILVKKQGKGTIVSDRKVKISFLSWMPETPRGGEILAELVRKFEESHPSIAVDIIPTTYPDDTKHPDTPHRERAGRPTSPRSFLTGPATSPRRALSSRWKTC